MFCVTELLIEFLFLLYIPENLFYKNIDTFTLLSKILILVYVAILAFFSRKDKAKSMLILFSLLSIAVIGGIYHNVNVLVKIFETNANFQIYLIMFLVLFICIFLVYYLSLSNDLENSSSMNRLIEQQLQHYKKYNSAIEKQRENERVLIHDFKHHLLSIENLMEKEKNDDAIKYVQDLRQNYFPNVSSSFVEISGNISIDSVLIHYLDLCRENSIKVIKNIMVPKDLDFQSSSLSVLLGNLMENAVDANLSVEEKSRFIDISLKFIKNTLSIKIRNPYLHKLHQSGNNTFFTSKKDKYYHGIGLTSVNKIVNRYNGEIEIQTNDNIFYVKVFLLIED